MAEEKFLDEEEQNDVQFFWSDDDQDCHHNLRKRHTVIPASDRDHDALVILKSSLSIDGRTVNQSTPGPSTSNTCLRPSMDVVRHRDQDEDEEEDEEDEELVSRGGVDATDYWYNTTSSTHSLKSCREKFMNFTEPTKSTVRRAATLRESPEHQQQQQHRRTPVCRRNLLEDG